MVVCPNCSYQTEIECNYKTCTNYTKLYKCLNPNCEMIFKIIYYEKPKNWIDLKEKDFK